MAWSIHSLGEVVCRQGDYGTARDLFVDSLVIRRELGDERGAAECLEGLAIVIGAQGEPERASWLFGAIQALRERIGATLPPADRVKHKGQVESVRSRLGETAFAAALAAGRAITLDQAITEALEEAAKE
jgi:hypothetical protein